MMSEKHKKEKKKEDDPLDAENHHVNKSSLKHQEMLRSRSPSPSRNRHTSRSHRDREEKDKDRDGSSSKHRSSRHHHRSRDDSEDEDERRRRKEKDRRREKERDEDRGRDREKERKRRSHDSEDEEKRRHRKKEKKSKRETSTERAERKAAKKAARIDAALEDADAAHRAAAAEVMMYSAEDNPFNDANLGHQFKWGKKEDKEKKMGMTPEEAKRRDELRRKEAHEEIARLNIKRAEREKEQAIREEEEARMARLQESAQMSEWVAKEDDFHLEQSRRRAAIRIRENRAKPIDLLAINLKWADPMVGQKKKKVKGKGKEKERANGELGDGMDTEGEDEDEDEDEDDDEEDEDEEAGLEIDLEEPYTLFDNLDLAETEELHQDITMYLTLESNEENLDFWRSMIVVCDDALSELKTQAGEGEGPASRLDSSVKSEMNEMLSRKSHEDLLTLQDQVRAKLRSGEPMDVEYWEGLLKSIVVWKAKAKLRDLHEVVLSNRLEYLRRKQRKEARKQQKELGYQMGMGDSNFDASNDLDSDSRAHDADELAREHAIIQEQEDLDAAFDEEEMEPEPVNVSRLSYDERHLPVSTFEEDRVKLIAARRAIVGSTVVARRTGGSGGGVGEDGDPASALYRAEAGKALDAEEETFNRDENLARQTYAWEDKYRPRKPRYFNRVHTGYEWNKYNQTHYDTENPPPKVVQGYKFNIFYPDLIDKSNAPSYRIVKEPGNDETVILKFTAGAPYEDIAFRIVNKEWVYGHRRGFRSSFDRGILQLYFNFARMRYRK